MFALTLPLSKSAGNVLLFLIYPAVAAGALFYKDFRQALVANIRQPLTVAFLLYYLVALVGVLFTESYADGLRVANKFSSMPAIYLMASALIQAIADDGKRQQTVESLLFFFLIGLMGLNGIGMVTWLGFLGHERFALPLAPMNVHHIWYSNINALGLYIAAAFLLFSPRGREGRDRLFLISSIVFAVLGILLSISRTAWFGVALTSVIMIFLVTKKKKAALIAVAATAAVGAAAFWLIPFVHDRISLIASDIEQFFAGEPSGSLGGRFLMWKASLMMFLSNPLTGVGTGDYVSTMIAYVKSEQLPEFLLQFNQPHNMYLFALATNGLPGLAALVYIFYRALSFALPKLKGGEGERLLAFVAAAAAVHFLIAGLTDSFFNIQILRYAFVLIMGVCVRGSLEAARSS